MTPRRPFVRCAAAIAVGGALSIAVAPLPAGAAPPPGSGTPVTVMTRNLYLGADITRPLDAIADLPPGADLGTTLVTLAVANHGLRAMVDQTDFPARSVALAREIAATDPALVGLQEVALWRSGPLELPPPFGQSPNLGKANAATVDYDFLATLLAQLRTLGEPYEAVSVQQMSDVEGPAFAAPTSAAIASGRDVRLTMRDVVLRRVGSGVKVEATSSGQYEARLEFGVGPVQYAFVRGWNAVDVRLGAKRFRFVNTHLESQYSFLADAQARELLAGPADVDRPVVLVCDCNSDPLDGSQKALPSGADVPHWTAYRTLTGEGGFTDGWLQVGSVADGHTSGLSEGVDDTPAEAAAGFDHRIDLVLVRGAGGPVTVDRGTVVGRDPAQRTASGLWPSDHAGVVLRVRP